MINLGRDMSSFFPDVIRIMVNDHAELKKLIFIYVLAYASDNQVCFFFRTFVCIVLLRACTRPSL